MSAATSRCFSGALTTALVAVLTTMSQAQPVVYPAKGQSPQQQQQDQGECQTWAKNQAAATATPPAQPAPSGPQGGRVKGAARGAVLWHPLCSREAHGCEARTARRSPGAAGAAGLTSRC